MATFNLQGTYKHLLVAPSSLQDGIIKRIEREKMKAESFQPCGIFMKMNSLTDRKIIDELSKASNAGVPIFLLIRGICCIRPGIPGKTENIRVESIVGRFLEHSRIYAFGVGDDTEIYISSADMMTRNTRRRVEVAAPIYDPRLKQRILKMINVMKQDNIQAQVLLSNGEYTTKKKREDNMNSQIHFLNEAKRLAPKEKTQKQNLFYQVKGIFFGKKKLRKNIKSELESLIKFSNSNELPYQIQLSNKFISDPTKVLSVGEIIKVKILSIDKNRGRVALTRKGL